MWKIHMLAAALAGAFLALPALAAPSLAGKTWTDDECMIAFEFRADFSFIEHDMDEKRTGRWRLDAGTLYLQIDGGESVQTPISDDMFGITYPFRDGGGGHFSCSFMPSD